MERTTEDQITESAEAISQLKTSADLDARIASSHAAFEVVMPEGYTPEEVECFKRFINETLVGIAKEAHEQVKFERTWNKLGADE